MIPYPLELTFQPTNKIIQLFAPAQRDCLAKMQLWSHLVWCNIRDFSGDRASIAGSDRLQFILHGPYTLGLKSASALKQGEELIVY